MILKEIGSSGVVQWPETANISATVQCIICENDTPLEHATTGSRYADGRQAFACNEHKWSRSSWALAWLQFSYEQTQYCSEEEKVAA